MKKKLLSSRNVFYAFIIILSIAIFSSALTGGLYARYTTGDSSSDEGTVAMFLVTADVDSEHITLDAYGKPVLELGGDTDIKTASLPFFITSESQIAVKYTVSVDFGASLPTYLNVTLTDGTRTTTLACDGVTEVFTFSDFGSIAPFTGVSPVPVDLELILTVTDTNLIYSELQLSSATLTVTVEQID